MVLAVIMGKQERLSRMIEALRERHQRLGGGAAWLLTTEELMNQVDTTTGAGPAFERIWYDAVRPGPAAWCGSYSH